MAYTKRAPPKTTRRTGKPKYVPRRRACAFCADKGKDITYKEPASLRRYISDRCKIEPRRRSGNCAKHQRAMALAIKRARHLALLPFVPVPMRRIGTATLRELH